MTSSVISQVTIKARPAAVFKYLADLNYHFLWNPHLQNLSPRMVLKKGVSYQTTSMLLGVKVVAKNQVTKFASNQELQIENSTGTLKYRVNYQLRRQEQSTTLVCTTKVSADSPSFAFSRPVLKMLARRELRSDLEALKLAVEQQLG